MKIIKKASRAFRIFLFAFMFAVCMVMGIAPIVPKRKEEFQIEVNIEEKEMELGGDIMFKADSE